MLRARGFALALILVACDAHAAEPAPTPPVEPAPVVVEPIAEPEAVVTEPEPEVSAQPPRSEPERPCCRTCNKGKACGDSCIARTSTCEKPPGCACDAESVEAGTIVE